jgi:hypothetical protein
MRNLKLMTLLGLCLMIAPAAHAARIGVAIGVGPAYGAPVYVGAPPLCAYGYYSYYPYACAPYGYYGPNWFLGGVFIGAGPWYHGFRGRPGFYGGRGYYGHGPVFRGHEDFRGGVNRGYSGGHYNGGTVHGTMRGGDGNVHGGANFRGGGHR